MKLHINGRAIAGTIAALLLATTTACSGQTQADDKWLEWNSGETIPEFATASQQLGVEIMVPTNDYINQDYIGVAQLGTVCLVTFNSPGAASPSPSQDASEAQIEVEIISRFKSTKPQVYIVGPSSPVSEGTTPAASFIARWRDACSPQGA